MAEARYRVRASDPDYGRVCPECAGPKREQSRRCAACYVAARRRGEYPPPPVLRGPEKPNWKGGVSQRRGGSKSRPQPQTHPWRAKNALLFRPRNEIGTAPAEMATAPPANGEEPIPAPVNQDGRIRAGATHRRAA